MNKDQNAEKKIAIKCECGKTLAYWIDGKIMVKCRTCKRTTPLNEKNPIIRAIMP